MCLLLASKYDELDDHIPMVRDFQKLSRYLFTHKECLIEEEAILTGLNWSLMSITSMHFLQSLLGMGVVFEDDRQGSKLSQIDEHSLMQVRKFSEFFIDFCAKHWAFQSYRPSVLAVSAIVCARLVNKIYPLWNNKLSELTNYKFVKDGIKSCFEKIFSLYDQNFKI